MHSGPLLYMCVCKESEGPVGHPQWRGPGIRGIIGAPIMVKTMNVGEISKLSSEGSKVPWGTLKLKK